MTKKKSNAAEGGEANTANTAEPHMSFGDVLKLTPEEIQTWLDARLEAAPEDVKAIIAAIDYVEPGSVRAPGFDYYVTLGQYEGDRDTIEIAFQVQPAAELPLDLMLRLL